ncbi:MAG: TolC family protein [Pseudobdellovibrio sp.]
MRISYILCAFFIGSVAAGRTLTWNEAINLAQQNSLEYQTAFSNYKSVEELEISGVSGFLPRITASTSGTQSGVPIGPVTNSYSAQLSLTQNLFSGLSDISNYYLKKTNTQKALANFNSAKSKLSAELKQAYANLYYIQDFKKLAQDIVKRRNDNSRNVKLQYDNGRENKGSLLLSQSYVESAEYDVLTSQHDHEVATETLRRVLGLPAEEEIVISLNIAKDAIPLEKPNFSLMAERHPDVISAGFDENISLYNVRISRAQFLPSLDFSGSYGYSDTKYFPENDKWSVGLTLSLPLFEGFKSYSSYHSNKAQLSASESSSKNTVLKITTSIKRSYYDYLEAIQKEKIDENFSKAAVLRAEVARNKYKNGFITFEEWDNIETDLISRQKEMLGSERNRIIKQSVWEQAQGIGVF